VQTIFEQGVQMENEPELKDANPATEDLPNKGKIIIQFIVGGIALLAVAILGSRIRPVGLAAGMFTFFSGITMLVRSLRSQNGRQFNFKPALIITAAGFLLLLANPRFGVVAGFAAYFVVVGAIGLIAFGLVKAIKLAWDLGKWT